MHDPKTVAHEIFGLRGWLHKWRRDHAESYDWKNPRFNYLMPLVTVWHVDPETDGSDDSCGFTYPKTPRKMREKAEKIVELEWQYMFGQYPYRYQPPSAFEVVYAVWQMIAWRIFRRRHLVLREIEEVADLASRPSDNLRAVIFDAAKSAESARRLGALVLRCYLRTNRPWYRHPKWHIHHWQLQVHAIQKVKRFLFSRCQGCGESFGWGYAPTGTGWDGTGPLWFRREKDVYHSECVPNRKREAA